MAHRSKTYEDARQRLDREREYAPVEAISLVKQLSGAKFNESVEVHVRTGLNVRHADEQLRGTISLPHGVGREQTIAVFARGDKAREAQEAGADVVGDEDLAKRIEEGFTDFDVAIATPDLMPVVGKLGRILGPQGKMPNPKVGTVTQDIRKAVEESKAGKVEYRTDRNAIVHLTIGKRDFEDRRLLENYQAVIEEIIRAKPSAAKGRYLRSIVFASTQGPGIKVDPTRIRDIVDPGRLDLNMHWRLAHCCSLSPLRREDGASNGPSCMLTSRPHHHDICHPHVVIALTTGQSISAVG